MVQFFSKPVWPKPVWPIQLMTPLMAGLALALLAPCGSACLAQPAQKTPEAVQASDTAAQKSASDKSTKPSIDESKLVRSIYELTKTTKTAKQLTDFVAKCDSALQHNLNSKNSQYVSSLKGWALNLRGQKRMATGLQLKKVGNSQSDSIIKQAMADFDEAIVNAPERYRSWMSRGNALAQTGNFKDAALNFTEVIKLKTDLADGWFNRAESLYHLKEFKAAISDYETVLRLNSDDAQALTGLGHSKLALGKYEEALADYQAVVKLQPQSPIAYVNVGDAFQETGNWNSAQQYFEKSIAIKPTGVAMQRAAWLKATCPETPIRDPQQAINLANRAISLTGHSVINLDTLAAAQAAAGEFEGAKTTQRKTIALASSIEAPAETGENQYKARLALYQEQKPFTLATEPKSSP